MEASTSRSPTQLEHARRRTLRAVGAARRRRPRAQVSPLMSPLVWDLAHIGNYEELWLLRDLDGRARHRSALRRPLQRVRAPAPGPSGAAHPRSRRRAGVTSPTCATASSTRLAPRRTSTAGDPLLARRLRLRHGRPARAPARRDDARDHPAHGRRADAPRASFATTRTPPAPTVASAPDELALPRRRVRDGHATPSRGPTTTSVPRTRSRSRRSASTRTPVTNAAYLAFVGDGGYDDPRLWTDDGWAWRMEADLEHPQFWRRESAGDWSVAAVRPPARPHPDRRRARPARLLVRSRRVRALGRQAAADRGRVGVRGDRGAPTPASAGTRGATPIPTTRAPTSARPATARSPQARGPVRRERVGRRADGRRRVGVDVVRLHALPRVRVVPVPRVLRGVLRRRVQGAARRLVGDAPERAAHHVPQLGLPDPPPDLRRLPLRATPDPDRAMCRHLAYLGPPVDARLAPARTRRTRSLTRPRRRATRTAGREPRRLRGRVVPGRRARTRQRRAAAVPHGRPRCWDDVEFAALARRATATAAFVAAVRLASPGSPVEVSGQRAVRRRALAVRAQRRRGPTSTASARALRAERAAAARRGHRGRHRQRGAVRAWSSTASTRARRRPRHWSATVAAVTAPQRPGKLNLLLTDGHRIAGHRVGATRCSPATDRSGAGTVHPVASEPLDDDPAWDASPTARSSPRRHRRVRGHRPLTGRPMTGPIVRQSTSTSIGRRPRPTRCATDVRDGLTASPKELPPKWFYDDRGCELFDEITRLPEYYPTERRAGDPRGAGRRPSPRSRAPTRSSSSARARRTRRGSCSTRSAEAGQLQRFVPFDVSETTLRDAAAAIAAEYPGIDVHAVVGDFERHLGPSPRGGRRLVAFLGGTIGNLAPAERARVPRRPRRRHRARATRSCSAPTW